MPVLSLNSQSILENNSSWEYLTFRVTIDQPSAAPTTFRWFTLDGTASADRNDYNQVSATSVTIPAGSTYADIRVTVYGDRLLESDETFQVVVLPGTNASIAGGGAALIATGKIIDDESGLPSSFPGTLGPAEVLMPPAAQPGVMPTITAYNVGHFEGDSGSGYTTFLVLLDRPATADISMSYHLQGFTAHDEAGDFGYDRGTLNISTGATHGTIRVRVYGDTRPEGNEAFNLILTAPRNAVFEGGAAALSATATIIDNDLAAPDRAGGIGGRAEQIFGPDTSGPQPTLRVQDVSVLEGNSGTGYATLLLTLDRAGTVPITLDYYTQDGSADSRSWYGGGLDYGSNWGGITIPAGVKSMTLRIPVYGDQRIETNESFSVVFTGIANARFENNAPALEATVTILEDDLGIVDGTAGYGDPARGIEAPSTTSPLVPVLQVHEASSIEGDSSSNFLRFLVTLDRPAASPVSLRYVTMDGTATAGRGDYAADSGSLTIPIGEQSAWISVRVYGDIAIEGDEAFSLMLYGIQNANFVGNAPALVARGTIIDDDGASLSGPAGIGEVAPGAVGAAPSPNGIVVSAASITVAEGNSGSQIHYVPVLLSEAARSDVTITWETRENGSNNDAVGGSGDFMQDRGTLTIPRGQSAGVIAVRVYGDTLIEGDESFIVRLTSATGAGFAPGQTTIDALVRISDDDGAGTGTGAHPEFTLVNGPSNGNDLLHGTTLNDVINAGGGNDTVYGLEGNDSLHGGEGNDQIYGGDGSDWLSGDAGRDTLYGGDGTDTLIGGHGDDFLYGGSSVADLRDVLYGGDGNDQIFGGHGNDELHGGAGNDTLHGDFGSDTLIGNDGDDVMSGGAGSDELHGGAGNDWFNGGFGFDRLNGGAGADTFFHQGIADHGSDWIQDYRGAQGDVLAVGIAGATRAQFQVNFTKTAGAGNAAVDEAFVIYRPTGQILFALVDGKAEDAIWLNIGGTSYNLLG